jgi:hypothetical protein
MRYLTYLALPLLLLIFFGCADQTTAPDVDLFAPNKKPPPPPPDPVGDANPVIAFESGGPGARALWVMEADGSNKTEIVVPGNYFIPSWSPLGDGKVGSPYEVLITSTSTGLLPVMKVEILTDGGVTRAGATRTLSTELNYVQARISPDGYHFVAVKVGPAPDFRNSLVLANLETFDPVEIHSQLGREAYEPTWNGTGSKIGFLDYDQASGLVDMMILDPATSSLTTAMENPCGAGFPRGLSWSPVSNEMAFDCSGTLYTVVLDGGYVAEGPPVARGAGKTPIWSPDGSKIIYNNGDRLYVKTINSTKRDVRLTNGRRPDWKR